MHELTIFTSLSGKWLNADTCKASVTVRRTLTTIQTWILSTWISYKRNTTLYIFDNAVICERIKTCSMHTSFTSWTTKATRAYTLIANIAIDRLTCTTVHAWITLTCISNFTSTAGISWWTYTTKSTIISHTTALIHAWLRSTWIA